MLANVISGAPEKGRASYNDKSKQEDRQKKSKKSGLFLRFRSRNDENIEKAKNVTAIFDGQSPLYFYFADEKKYELQNRALFVDVNETMLAELSRILGKDNVAFIE